MLNTNLSVNILNCNWFENNKGSRQMDNLMHIMKEIYKMAGGNTNVLPYLLAMENHDVNKDFICGGIVSNDVKVLLDYVPSDRSLNIKISSNGKGEEVIKYLKNSFSDCLVEMVK